MPVTASQRLAARVGAGTYLVALASVIFANFGIHERLFVRGNAVETARNILAHETLFRIGAALDVVYCVGLVVLIAAFYIVLQPAHRGATLLASLSMLVYAMTWVAGVITLFSALRLVQAGEQVQARLELSTRFDQYYVGLVFYGLGVTAWSWAWLRSRYIPKALALWGVIASAWCAFCAVAFLAFPGFANAVNLWWFDSPMGAFEMTTSVWLLIRGPRAQV